MTTILYCPKTRTITSDTRETCKTGGVTRATDGVTKFVHVYDGVFAFAGNYAYGIKYAHKLKRQYERASANGDIPQSHTFVEFCVNSVDEWESLIKEESGLALWLFSKKERAAFELYCAGMLLPIFLDEVQAIGTGCEYAIGAWAAGAAPDKCVAIASRFDVATNALVETVKVLGHGN